MSLLFPKTTARQTEASVADTQVTVDAEDAYYRRLGAAPRDLIGTSLKRAQDLSLALYRANPLAHRAINIYRSFLAGDGFGLEASNLEVQSVLDDFWGSPRNRLDRVHGDYARDALIFGEAHHPWGFDDTGNATMGFIDPGTVKEIHRDPTNNMLLEQVIVTSGRYGADDTPLRIVRVDTDPTSDDPGLWVGQISTWLFDRIAAGTRGTPFLLPALDWLDAYDQILWELLERQKALRAFFWAVTVEGGPDEVAKAKELFGTAPPRSGSNRFMTDAMKVEAVTPGLGAQEDVTAATFQLRHIATGVSLAPHWLGEPEDANRSTAEQMDVPVLRSLVDTQAWWRDNMTEACEVAVDAKVRAGMLDRVLPETDSDGNPVDGTEKPARDHIRVLVPEIEDRKVEQAAASLASVAQAFGSLEMLGAIGPETMRLVVRQMLPALGVPADELPDEDADDDTIAQALESYRRRGDAERLRIPG